MNIFKPQLAINIRIFDDYPDSYLNICTYSDNIGFNLWKGFFMEKKGSKLSDFTKMKIQITKVFMISSSR